VLTVPRLPTRAGVDPYRKTIERDRDDNVAEVGGKSGSGAGQSDP
jgi:ABC-2 type transport system permease protein